MIDNQTNNSEKTKSLKETVLSAIKKVIKKEFGSCPKGLNLIFPPKIEFGDFALECFSLAKEFNYQAVEIAQKISNLIKPTNTIQKVQAIGPYINIKVFNHVLFSNICQQIINQNDNFGNISIGKNERVMIEYLSPNTNKPLHLGHIRNGCLGMALANLLQALGYEVVKTSLINDRGVHICKSMLAWERWGKQLTPKTAKMKGDHFVGKWYVRYEQEAKKNPEIKKEILEMLKKWETDDPKTIKVWKKMNRWVETGFSKTYQDLGLKFDTFYYESETYKLGKNIVTKGLKNGIFTKDKQGNVVLNLPKSKFGLDKNGELKKVTVLRPDGTSLYITQDIGTAIQRVKQWKLNRLIYVVGNEQTHHFKSLFEILDVLKYKWSKNCYHLSYGMVYLPEGKMKSREGNVVDADELIEKMKEIAKQEILKRYPEKKFSAREIEKRASAIGIGAIKFYLLRIEPKQEIYFNPKESISFDGFTGPYCQYAYARIAGILKKIKDQKNKLGKVDFSVLGNKEELRLIQKLAQFPEKIKTAGEQFNPSCLCIHIFDIAKAFNQFYNKHNVLAAEKNIKEARIALIKATAIVLKKGLDLLDIKVLEEM